MGIRCEFIVKLAKELGRPVTIYDLETTGLPQQGPVGIVEVACATVLPNGQAFIYDSLIKPDVKFTAKAQEITGITMAMVQNAEPWTKRYAQHFQEMAKSHLMIGFNNETFDDKVINAVGLRLGMPATIEKSADVRKLYLRLTEQKGNAAGKLMDVAAYYGVTPQGAYHRAKADVTATMEILDVMLEIYGMDRVISLIEKEKVPLEPKSIKAFCEKNPEGTFDELVQFLGKKPEAISFELGAAIDERFVDGMQFADKSMIEQLVVATFEAPENVLKEKKLKVWKNYFQLRALDPSYVEIRVALLQAGIEWSSLKPLTPP